MTRLRYRSPAADEHADTVVTGQRSDRSNTLSSADRSPAKSHTMLTSGGLLTDGSLRRIGQPAPSSPLCNRDAFMGIRSIDYETMPCPPPDDCDPESGEYSTASVRVPIRSSDLAPRLAQTIEEELRERLAAVHCPEHGRPAVAELSVADDGSVHIVPVGCCDQVNRLVLATLSESVTLAHWLVTRSVGLRASD